jgi:hypothetical protein
MVIAGLVPAIPISRPCLDCRDRRDKPGDDVLGWLDVIGTCSSVLVLTFVFVIPGRDSGRGSRTRNPVNSARRLLDSGFASAPLRRPGMTPIRMNR